MRPGSAGFSAREAVAGWTPARCATSRIVGRRATRSRPGGGARSASDLGPVVGRRLALLELVARPEAGRHRRVGAGHDLVVVDVQHPQPALLAERQADEASELDQLRLGEVRVHALPEGVVGVEVPRDRLGVRERRLLALVVGLRALEVEELVVLALDEAEPAALLGALVAAVLALDRARDVDAAQLLDA